MSGARESRGWPRIAARKNSFVYVSQVRNGIGHHPYHTNSVWLGIRGSLARVYDVRFHEKTEDQTELIFEKRVPTIPPALLPAPTRSNDRLEKMKRILVVEDQADNLQILRDLLSHAGYEMLEAQDGQEGVRMAKAELPDLILMDVQLPTMDGYEATRLIKAEPALKATPIIMVTSYALSGDETNAQAAGCDAYVPKPYSPRHLLAKIKTFLP
jgi:two-component system, cell cycle response regulator DivK